MNAVNPTCDRGRRPPTPRLAELGLEPGAWRGRWANRPRRRTPAPRGLIYVVGDNGASAEGGPAGTLNADFSEANDLEGL